MQKLPRSSVPVVTPKSAWFTYEICGNIVSTRCWPLNLPCSPLIIVSRHLAHLIWFGIIHYIHVINQYQFVAHPRGMWEYQRGLRPHKTNKYVIRWNNIITIDKSRQTFFVLKKMSKRSERRTTRSGPSRNSNIYVYYILRPNKLKEVALLFIIKLPKLPRLIAIN